MNFYRKSGALILSYIITFQCFHYTISLEFQCQDFDGVCYWNTSLIDQMLMRAGGWPLITSCLHVFIYLLFVTIRFKFLNKWVNSMLFYKFIYSYHNMKFTSFIKSYIFCCLTRETYSLFQFSAYLLVKELNKIAKLYKLIKR